LLPSFEKQFLDFLQIWCL